VRGLRRLRGWGLVVEGGVGDRRVGWVERGWGE